MKMTVLRSLALCLAALLTLSFAACATPDSTDNPVGPAPSPAGAASSSTSAATQPPSTQPLPLIPDFKVLDIEGNTVKLSDFFGRPIILNFWATWCPPCKAELPDFNTAAAAHGDEVVFLMVNLTDGVRDTVNTVKEFVAANEYTFPVYFDTEYSAANAYRVSSIPTTYFINAEGAIIHSKVGIVSEDELSEMIRKLME